MTVIDGAKRRERAHWERPCAQILAMGVGIFRDMCSSSLPPASRRVSVSPHMLTRDSPHPDERAIEQEPSCGVHASPSKEGHQTLSNWPGTFWDEH